MQRDGRRTQRVSAMLPPELLEALERRAAREGRSVKEVAEDLLERHVREHSEMQ